MNTKNIKTYSACRLCNSEEIEAILDFGSTPLANSYVTEENLSKKEFEAPLELFQCTDCGSVQLKHTVNPRVLFSNYLYASSTSNSFRQHFKKYAGEVKSEIGLKSASFVVEIGSNDGILLGPFQELGMKVLGVEPAENIAAIAREKGIETTVKFFNVTNAKAIKKSHGQADLIVANNVFAHIDKIKSVVKGVKTLLNKDGVFVFENAYLLDTIKGKYFDQVYSEHLFYHSIKPLASFFQSYGMEIFHVERNDIQGGTIRVFVKKKNGQQAIRSSVAHFIQAEEEFGLYDLTTYVNFKAQLEELKADLKQLTKRLKQENKKIVAYGAPAKFTTFCSYFELDGEVIDFVIDDATLKQGLYTPGSHIKIVSNEYLYTGEVDYCLVTAWNFAKFIIEKHKTFLENGGKFIVPFPQIKIVGND